MYLEQVNNFLNEHGGKGTCEITPEVMEEYLEACKAALESVTKKNEFRFPRPSSLGHPARKMWYMRNNPEIFGKEVIPPNLRTTFYQGHMLEAYYVALMRMAKVPLDAVQQQVSITLAGEEVKGTLDYIIDGKVYDAKSANSFSYKEKWKTQHTLFQKDSYHYVQQAAIYQAATGLPFEGWHLFNKDTGETKTIPATGLPLQQELEQVEANLKASQQKEAPVYCYGPVEEVYKPKGQREYKTGNVHLHPDCVKCPAYKEGMCKPAEITAIGKTSYSEIHYTKFKKNHKAYVKVEIIE